MELLERSRYIDQPRCRATRIIGTQWFRAWLFTLMHNQNVNTVRRTMREGVSVDMEELSSPLIATTDPAASRKLFELERAIGRVPLEQRQVILLIGISQQGPHHERQLVAGDLGAKPAARA
jgi:DNA-directed RNA polymerase specialized sigma24 family protein